MNVKQVFINPTINAAPRRAVGPEPELLLLNVGQITDGRLSSREPAACNARHGPAGGARSHPRGLLLLLLLLLTLPPRRYHIRTEAERWRPCTHLCLPVFI